MEDFKTVWKLIFDVLKEDFEVYPPMEKVGDCLEPYIVLKNNGANSTSGLLSSNYYMYSVMCYVPEHQYSYLEEYVMKVKKKMNDERIRFMVQPTGIETTSFYDSSIKAHMISVEYQNIRRLLGYLRDEK